MGKNFENINFDSTVRKCFERACIISDIFDDEKIRSAYVMISMFCEEGTSLSNFFAENGYKIIPELVMNSILNYKAVYSNIFGQKAADKFFEQVEQQNENQNKDSNIESCEQTPNEVVEVDNDENSEESKEEFELSDEEKFKAKILDALGEMITSEFIEIDNDYNLDIIYSDKLLDVCEDAATRCLSGKQNFLDFDNLLYSLIKNENTSAYKVLDILVKEYKLEISDILDYLEQNSNIYVFSDSSIILPKALENCCTILNDKFTKGQKSDILGRDKELFKLWNIFSKKTKRNSALVGHPGVGKTAIVEALVQDIVNKSCPKEFYDYTVIEFDVGAALAGTKYRGEFEDKINKLKKFLQNTPKVILFVDEMHQMIGAGTSEGGGVDLSGALKPILSRDDVVFIGSTTTEEYRKYMLKDLAFERRFISVVVEEPKYHEVYDMIKARIETLSKYHKVSVDRDLIDYIIICASAFNRTGHNPDISIDLCDNSMAIAKMRNSNVLERKDIEKVNEEGYEKFKKFPEIKKKSISIHESAHYVVSQETSRKDIEKPVAITIIPSNGCLGFYKYEINDSCTNGTQQNYLDEIYSLLAGRVAQQVYLYEHWDDGATGDIEAATNIAKKMITELSLITYSDTNLPLIFDDDYKYISDARKEMITKKAEQIVSDAYKEVEEILYRPDIREKIMKVSDLLLEKKIVTAKELEKCIK